MNEQNRQPEIMALHISGLKAPWQSGKRSNLITTEGLTRPGPKDRSGLEAPARSRTLRAIASWRIVVGLLGVVWFPDLLFAPVFKLWLQLG